MINKMFILVALLGVVSLMPGCKDDSPEVTLGDIPVVSNLRFESIPGGVDLFWDKPEDRTNLSYVEILYDLGGDDERRVLVDIEVSTQRLYGMASIDPLDVKIRVFNDQETSSEAIAIEVTPGKAPLWDLIATVELNTTFEGATISYNNTSDEEFALKVDYSDRTGTIQSRVLNVIANEESTQELIVAGVLKTTLSVTAEDVYGNVSTSLEIPYAKLEKGIFDRSAWSIIDFTSQETTGEGVGNGVVAAMLDGNKGTFWHSQWSGGYVADGYPYHATFDLQRVVQMDSVQTYQRHNNDMAGNVVIEVSNSSEGPWIEAGRRDLSQWNGASDWLIFEESVTGRYVKFLVTKHGGGNSSHVAMAEFILYGQDIIDE